MRLFQVIAQHDAPVRDLFFVKEMGSGMLLTGSWDKTLRYWDLRWVSQTGWLPSYAPSLLADDSTRSAGLRLQPTRSRCPRGCTPWT